MTSSPPPLFHVDASAWIKLYLNEAGTAWMRRFWTSAPSCASATLGFVEVMATVVRRNRGANIAPSLTASTLASVRRDFQGFIRVHLDAAVLATADALPERHGLRGADSIHLASALLLRQAAGRPVILIASDLELLNAARNEGLAVLDPSTGPPQPPAPPTLP